MQIPGNFYKPFVSNFLFWLGWILLSFQYGHFKRMGNEPESVHQGAQCDRASIALNYYQGGMHFSTPQVHESRTTGGYTGCEFPLMNYSAAVCYKIFGVHVFWYRLFMWLCVSIGFFCFYRTLFFFNTNSWVNLLAVFLLSSSTILQFYIPNFLPDAASLGFILIAFYAFFSWHFKGFKYKYAAVLVVFASLASLVKITSLIGVFTMGSLVLLSFLSKNKSKLWEQRGWLIALLSIPIICTVIWYIYAGNFSKKNNSAYFLLDINPPESVSELKENFTIMWNIWWDSIFEKYFWWVVPGGLLMVIVFAKTNKMILACFLLLLASALVFMVAMLRQMRYHDYYFLPLWTVFLFGGLLVIESAKHWNKYIQISTIILSFLLFLGCHSKARILLNSRYEAKNYWHQSEYENGFYTKAALFALKNHITIKNRVISAYDDSPNNSLYFLNLKGYRISHDHPTDYGIYIDSTFKAEYLILNDTSFFTKHPVFKAKATFMDSAGKILFYRLSQNM